VRAVYRIARAVLTLISVLLPSLVGSSVVASAQAASPNHTWRLEDFGAQARR
jgi:hypothetical protein